MITIEHIKVAERRAQVRPTCSVSEQYEPWTEPQVNLSLLRKKFFKIPASGIRKSRKTFDGDTYISYFASLHSDAQMPRAVIGTLHCSIMFKMNL
jgi:hypothetical protein